MTSKLLEPNEKMDDRVNKDIPLPPGAFMGFDDLFSDGPSNPPDWKLLKEFLTKEGRVTKRTVLAIIQKARNLFVEEPNLLRLSDPLVVVGDVHGQYYDLVKLLDVGWPAGQGNILFLGDYVDRGAFSIAVMLLLLCIKLTYPEHVWMLRGNHECRQMTSFFNFKEECLHRYDATVYRAFMDLFDALPLGATINSKFFCVHGGLSPELRTLGSFDVIRRFQETPRQGLFCDLLWADPLDEEKHRTPARNESFITNEVRGCSFFFTQDAATSFLEKNRLLSIVRAHEAQLDGYKMHKVNHKTGFPTVITIFSAPNYCDCYNNKGAILKFDNNTLNIQQFNYVQHPYHLPSFTDIFTWSIPFVAIKVDEMVRMILGEPEHVDMAEIRRTKLPQDVLDFLAPSTESAPSNIMKTAQANLIRQKVIVVSRLLRGIRTLRQESELVAQLKQLSPDKRISAGSLFKGGENLRAELGKYQKTKEPYRKRADITP